MRLAIDTPYTLKILLVEPDGTTPAPGRSPTGSILIGQTWHDLPQINDVGRGWYNVLITGISQPGQVAITVDAPDTLEWRDVIDVIEPATLLTADHVRSIIADEISKASFPVVDPDFSELSAALTSLSDGISAAARGMVDAINEFNDSVSAV